MIQVHTHTPFTITLPLAHASPLHSHWSGENPDTQVYVHEGRGGEMEDSIQRSNGCSLALANGGRGRGLSINTFFSCPSGPPRPFSLLFILHLSG
ncbi:hypothetical protein IE53DRAFT_385656 [Violaceomyces palustris]|uniref:Uncharacterized protein n=1 Tax=Violaceomyces palustris TaxID=1673888 RepID=A0ACD0P1M3_9BASI|nr:hypothetical protein IE53DRAFT_385656 [Violaceomyces palustris]